MENPGFAIGVNTLFELEQAIYGKAVRRVRSLRVKWSKTWPGMCVFHRRSSGRSMNFDKTGMAYNYLFFSMIIQSSGIKGVE